MQITHVFSTTETLLRRMLLLVKRAELDDYQKLDMLRLDAEATLELRGATLGSLGKPKITTEELLRRIFQEVDR
jgi:hypothetical protein